MPNDKPPQEMNLQKFVETALWEISNAIWSVHSKVEGIGTTISPMITVPGLKPKDDRREFHTVQIEFDVAVTSMSSEGGSSGIGVFLGSFGVGKQATEDLQHTQLSRVKFSVPVVFNPRPIKVVADRE